jgi:hypothetical protein
VITLRGGRPRRPQLVRNCGRLFAEEKSRTHAASASFGLRAAGAASRGEERVHYRIDRVICPLIKLTPRNSRSAFGLRRNAFKFLRILHIEYPACGHDPHERARHPVAACPPFHRIAGTRRSGFYSSSLNSLKSAAFIYDSSAIVRKFRHRRHRQKNRANTSLLGSETIWQGSDCGPHGAERRSGFHRAYT